MRELYMAERTTINIEKQIREDLKKCRKYPRETYDETLKRLIKDKARLKK